MFYQLVARGSLTVCRYYHFIVQFPHSSATYIFRGPIIFLNTLFSNAFSFCSERTLGGYTKRPSGQRFDPQLGREHAHSEQ
jgi:hypothetical protein